MFCTRFLLMCQCPAGSAHTVISVYVCMCVSVDAFFSLPLIKSLTLILVLIERKTLAICLKAL